MLATTFLAAIVLAINVNGNANNIDERGGPDGVGSGGGFGNGIGGDGNVFGNTKPIPFSIWGPPRPAPQTPPSESQSSISQPPVPQPSPPPTTFQSPLDSPVTSSASGPEQTSSYHSEISPFTQSPPSHEPPYASFPPPHTPPLPPPSPSRVILSSAVTVMPIPQDPAGHVAGGTSPMYIGSHSHSHPKAIVSGEATASKASSSVVATSTAKSTAGVSGAGAKARNSWGCLLVLEIMVFAVGLR